MSETRFSLKGKVALVSGASRGLGRAIALGFAEAGASVAVAARSADALDKVVGLVRERGVDGVAVPADVTNPESVEEMVDATVRRFGRIDVLLNNVGMNISGLVAESVTPDQFDQILGANVRSMFLVGTAAARAMIAAGGSGSIVNMSSVLGSVAVPAASIYCTTKGAVNQLTRAWALEWSAHGIRVNALAPSYIVTALNAHLFEDAVYRENVVRRVPLGRVGREEDVVGPAVFLASDAAAYLTGHVLLVDGGWTIV